jgi:acetolactate synthase-1/2/3 large subunit
MARMTGGQALVASLKREGVDTLFGIPGIQLDWAYDALYAERDARGVTFSEAPKDLHGMRVGKILDPDGAEMSVGGR